VAPDPGAHRTAKHRAELARTAAQSNQPSDGLSRPRLIGRNGVKKVIRHSRGKKIIDIIDRQNPVRSCPKLPLNYVVL